MCICFYFVFFLHSLRKIEFVPTINIKKNLILLMQIWIFKCQNEKLPKLFFFVNVHWAAREYFENFKSFTLINRKSNILFRNNFHQTLLFMSIVPISRLNEQFYIYTIRLRKHINGKLLQALYISDIWWGGGFWYDIAGGLWDRGGVLWHDTDPRK